MHVKKQMNNRIDGCTDVSGSAFSLLNKPIKRVERK